MTGQAIKQFGYVTVSPDGGVEFSGFTAEGGSPGESLTGLAAEWAIQQLRPFAADRAEPDGDYVERVPERICERCGRELVRYDMANSWSWVCPKWPFTFLEFIFVELLGTRPLDPPHHGINTPFEEPR